MAGTDANVGISLWDEERFLNALKRITGQK